MSYYFGNIDLTRLRKVAEAHPELLREFRTRSGETHKTFPIWINEREKPDAHDNVAYIKAGVKRNDMKEGVDYILCDLKESQLTPNRQPKPGYQSDNPARTYIQQHSVRPTQVGVSPVTEVGHAGSDELPF